MEANIRFKSQLQEGKVLWPENLIIGDGRLLDDGGFASDSLIATWEEAERLSEEKYPEDLWHELIVWSIYRTIHRVAVDKFISFQQSFNINDIEFREFEMDFKIVIQESVPPDRQEECFFD